MVGTILGLSKYMGGWGRRLGVSVKYYLVRRKFPNLRHPQDLSEIILSSICKPEFINYYKLADKVLVREYVKQKGLEHILLKHYSTWDNVDEIDISKLPEKFILKPNNGSGGHVVCRDKSMFDLKAARQYLKENLQRAQDYFYEPQYLHIRPLIFAEEFLDLGVGKVLTDYKFTCIKGKIADIFLAGENSIGERNYATVDEDWNILPYMKSEYLMSALPEKPHHLKEMLTYAKVLSEGFDFVRVNFTNTKGKSIFRN